MEIPKEDRIDFIRIKDFISLCILNWKWFVVSILLITSMGVVYVLRSPSVFSRTMTIQIQSDMQGKSLPSNFESFEDLGIIQPKSNVLDEIVALQSPSIMTEVVKRLNLYIHYAIPGRFHGKELYGPFLPVLVSMPDWQGNESGEFTMHLQGNKVKLSDFIWKGDAISLPSDISATLSDTIASPLGRLLIEPTPIYTADNEYVLHVTIDPLLSTIRNFNNKLTVTQYNEKSSIVELIFKDTSISRIEEILNMLVAVYNENWMKDKNQIMVATSMFINERINIIERELGSVDENISSYKSENLLPDVQAASDLYISQNSAADAQLLSLNNQLYMTRYVRNYLLDNANKEKLLPVNSGIENMSIENQISEYNGKLLQRNGLMANSSTVNPLVMDMDEVLAELRKAIIASIDNQYHKLEMQIGSLQKDKSQVTAHLAANPSQAKFLLSIERQQKVKESLYLFLLQKWEENELAQAFITNNTRVITPPYGNDIPVEPQKRKIVLFAFVLSLLIPATILLIKKSLDTKVRDKKDVVELSLPFLGEIPQWNSKKRRKNYFHGKKTDWDSPAILVENGKRDIMNEAFRVLRTNLEFIVNKEQKSRIIILTSFVQGSGKTFLTINTAISLAVKGSKVLIIDGDLRRNAISKFIHFHKKGLSDYLAGEFNDIEKLFISKIELDADSEYTDENGKRFLSDNLHVLPVGTIPPNPTELLLNARFGQLLAEVRTRYDYIFIDCPPVNIMADSQIIGQYADYTIFIVRAGFLDRAMLPELEKIYRKNTYKNMSLVLNGTDMGGGHYGYKYGYHSYNYYTDEN